MIDNNPCNSERPISPISTETSFSIKNRDYFRTDYLNPAIDNGYVELTIPDKPNSRNQKYRLTAKGLTLKNSQINNK